MKYDKLEKFISENRDAFDLDEPSARVWENIDRRIGRPRKLSWTTVLMRVAAVIVIFFGSYYFHDFMSERKQGKASLENMMTEQPDALIQELVEAELFYTGQIATARSEIIYLTKNDPGIVKDLDTDLVELDQVLEELKNDLRENGQNEEVIAAMIQNYRLKLEILEMVLGQLNKSKESQNDEKDEI